RRMSPRASKLQNWNLPHEKRGAVTGCPARPHGMARPLARGRGRCNRVLVCLTARQRKRRLFGAAKTGLEKEITRMTYVVGGLDPAPYRDLFGVPDEQLAERGIVRMTVDGNGYPCRRNLTDPG